MGNNISIIHEFTFACESRGVFFYFNIFLILFDLFSVFSLSYDSVVGAFAKNFFGSIADTAAYDNDLNNIE